MQDLATDRLILRQLSVDDAPDFFRLYGDPETMRYMGQGPSSLAEEQRHIQQHILQIYPLGIGLRAVIFKATGTLIGYCGLLVQEIEDRPELEIAYLIDRAYWGRGLATEAAARTVQDWREHLTQDRLIALVDPRNGASARVAQKIGMRYARDVDYKTFGSVQLYLLARES
ncbi:MAG TPA: GNAT family N-acetyltransferase [Herpetosiphonaceae bacterium]